MASEGKVNRRRFIKGAAIAGLGLTVGGGLLCGRRTLAGLLGVDPAVLDQAVEGFKSGQLTALQAQSTVAAYMQGGTTDSAGVVHVHDGGATDWDFGASWYGDHVDQAAVNEMVAQGLMHLTGTASLAGAWAALLPTYQAGEKIAIKVNFNNSLSCSESDNAIDALIEPVNALVYGMKLAGIQEQDIWVMDPQKPMPSRFFSRSSYSGVRFLDRIGCAGYVGFVFESGAPSAVVSFPDRPTLRERLLADPLVYATYLINLPILKLHGIHPVSLGFKNHFGCIDVKPIDLHPYISPGDAAYSSTFSPMVDIYANAHIAGKTVLTVGEGLFGAPGATAQPARWQTFGNQAPNSLFFSRDPVAVDCVMADILDAEYGLPDAAYHYLQLAAQRGLGIFERGEPWGSGYATIDYLRVEL